MTGITEAVAEEAALDRLRETGWQTAYGPEIGPEGPSAERDDYGQVVLERSRHDPRSHLTAEFRPWSNTFPLEFY